MGPGVATGFGTEDNVGLEGNEFFQDFNRLGKTGDIVGIDKADDIGRRCSCEVGLNCIKFVFEVACPLSGGADVFYGGTVYVGVFGGIGGVGEEVEHLLEV